MDELDYCVCDVINGKRCTLEHGCLNRSVMVECPEVFVFSFYTISVDVLFA